MSLQITFCYDAEDKTQFEVEEVSGQGIGGLFEIYPHHYEDSGWQTMKSAGFYPIFVEDFPKLGDIESPRNWDDYSEEEQQEIMDYDGYVGPSFPAEELVQWTQSWIVILPNLEEDVKKALWLIDENGYDWAEHVLDNLKQINSQAHCAARHGVTMHIEMY